MAGIDVKPHDPQAIEFPPSSRALTEPNGLLFCGGQYSLPWLMAAYRRGIFPWGRLRDYLDESHPAIPPPHQDILWWTPSPRMVLQTNQFRWHRSLRKRWRQWQADERYRVLIDEDFAGTVKDCAQTPRERDGYVSTETWIEPALIQGYLALHQAGLAHSVETWRDDQRIGGLYFVNIGHMVFGESMFSHATDASKIALAALVQSMTTLGMNFIDCQQQTAHLTSLGAMPMPRESFEAELTKRVDLSQPDWPRGTNLLTLVNEPAFSEPAQS